MSYRENSKHAHSGLLRKGALMAAFLIAVGGAGSRAFAAGVLPLLTTTAETSAIEEDVSAPRQCVTTSDLKQVVEKTPELSRTLAMMKKLTLAGKPLFDKITDRNNGLVTCLVPEDKESNIAGGYAHGVTVVERGSDMGSSFHEFFHARQDIDSQGNNLLTLSAKDALAAYLLLEATGAAYELVMRAEAQLRGLELDGKPTGVSALPSAQKAFVDGYTQAWSANSNAEQQKRVGKSLEAGGQAVVRFLLLGGNQQWQEFYTERAVGYIAANQVFLMSDGREQKPNYSKHRDEVYATIGAVSPGINLIPPEYLGAAADKTVADFGLTLGLRIEPEAAQVIKFALPKIR